MKRNQAHNRIALPLGNLWPDRAEAETSLFGLAQEPAALTSLRNPLRVALIAGTLVQDGAEKQLVYMARALQEKGAEVRVYCLTRGEYYERPLQAMGIPPHWFGRSRSRVCRLLSLWQALREYRPHIVQSTHFYTNLYTCIPGRLCGSIAIGCSRNDVFSEVADNGRWGPWSLRLCPALLVNSQAAQSNAERLGVRADRIQVLGNVIDLVDFDARRKATPQAMGLPDAPTVMAIGRLVPQKRFDRFLTALAIARRSVGNLTGVLVGDGPLGTALQQQASDLGLLPDGVLFLGRRDDVPALLQQADMLALTSDYEGFPNVILEAMAARLPVITTPAGDAARIVEEGVTGCVVSFDDEAQMAACMVRLCEAPELCRQYGAVARQRVEQQYGFEGLADRLLAIYRYAETT